MTGFTSSWVGVVDDEGLLRVDAGTEKEILPVAGLEHVEVEAQVRREQPLSAERALAGGLDSAEDDRFHVRILRIAAA